MSYTLGYTPPPTTTQSSKMGSFQSGSTSYRRTTDKFIYIELDEIVEATTKIQAEDRRTVLELWLAATRQIQLILTKSKDADRVKQITTEQPLLKEVDSAVDCDSNSKEFDEGDVNSKHISIIDDIEDENDDDVREHVIGQDEEEEESCFATEISIPPGTSTQKNEEDKDKDVNKDIQVQSVHLMISADPVLVPNMSKFKKVFNNEATGERETTYQCEKCPKICRTAVALYKHRSSHAKTLECQICQQKLSNLRALEAHKKAHTKEKLFECSKCPSRFTTRGNLVRHVASHDGGKPWQCAICGKRYTEKNSLQVHTRTHTGEKPYACTVCPKRFAQSGILQAHMLVHLNKYSHLCDICGRAFRQRSQLVTHRLRHEGVRPYACNDCDRKFTTKGDLDRHIRTHTGERPFHCDVCGLSFARPQTLKEHKNRHYNFKPFVCKICNKSFHELRACSRHVQSLHGRGNSNFSVSANVLRLTKSAHQDEAGKNNVLIPELNAHEREDSSNRGDTGSNEMKGEEAIEVQEEQEEVKHHIFVMQSNENEETELITIAEPSTPHGVTVAEWLVQSHTGPSSDSLEVTVKDESADANIGCVEETTEELECMEQNGGSLRHAVTIGEDGSITSVPLSQFTPLHLQIENDYMVVLKQ